MSRSGTSLPSEESWPASPDARALAVGADRHPIVTHAGAAELLPGGEDDLVLPEITRPVDLCLPSGVLNPAAIGWTRRPLHRANLHPAPLGSRAATWSRTKRREHWVVVTEDHIITLTVNSLNYAAQHQVWILDRRDETEVEESTIVPLARQVDLPETSGGGPVRALTRDLAIAVDSEEGMSRLRVKTPRIKADLMVDTSSECLGVVIPWSNRQFQYTCKASAMPVTGRFSLDKEDLTIGAGSWASLDHGRGRWPYSTSYISGVGSGLVDGVRTGLHLGGLWTDGTGSAENALLLDGRTHYLGEDLVWEYDTSDPMMPWAIRGDRVEVELIGFHDRTNSTNLGIVATTSTQVSGIWSGWVADAEGTEHRVDGLVGIAEHTHNRW